MAAPHICHLIKKAIGGRKESQKEMVLKNISGQLILINW